MFTDFLFLKETGSEGMFEINRIARAVHSVSLDNDASHLAETGSALGRQVSRSSSSGYSSISSSIESLNELESSEHFQTSLEERTVGVRPELITGEPLKRSGKDSETSEAGGHEGYFDDEVEFIDGAELESSGGRVLERWGVIPDKSNANSELISGDDYDNTHASPGWSEADDWDDLYDKEGAIAERNGRVTDDELILAEREETDSDLYSNSDKNSETDSQISDSELSDTSSDAETFVNERQVLLWVDNNTGNSWVERSRVINKGEEQAELLADEKKEINFLSKLKHPNLVKMLGAEISEYSDDYESVLAMEYAGGTIEDAIKKLPEGDQIPALMTCTQEMLKGLTYLHEENILHRDIKPDNLLFMPESNKLTIIDLGLAEDCSDGFPSDPVGSGLYAAPEARAGRQQDYKADIFSAGRSVLEVMLRLGMVDMGWRRKSEGSNPELEEKWQGDERAVALINAVTAMINMDPGSRPDALQASKMIESF